MKGGIEDVWRLADRHADTSRRVHFLPFEEEIGTTTGACWVSRDLTVKLTSTNWVELQRGFITSFFTTLDQDLVRAQSF